LISVLIRALPILFITVDANRAMGGAEATIDILKVGYLVCDAASGFSCFADIV
jgi:hypothetical protein